MNLSRRTVIIALSQCPGIGAKSITRILTRCDLIGRAPAQFAELSREALIEEHRLSAAQAEAWSEKKEALLETAHSIDERLNLLGVNIITSSDAHYPALVEEMDSDPPSILYTYGNERNLDGHTFAVMSSRKSSEQALLSIEGLTEEGVLAGEILVTGHDTPEYQRSAIVPLRWGAPRVLVLDRGLFAALGEDLKEEPFRAARLWRYQFDAKTDLVVSAIAPDKPYRKESNKERDKLIASLSRRIDFVQINAGGNMEKLAKRALKAGRKVRICDEGAPVQQLQALGAEIRLG